MELICLNSQSVIKFIKAYRNWKSSWWSTWSWNPTCAYMKTLHVSMRWKANFITTHALWRRTGWVINSWKPSQEKKKPLNLFEMHDFTRNLSACQYSTMNFTFKRIETRVFSLCWWTVYHETADNIARQILQFLSHSEFWSRLLNT